MDKRAKKSGWGSSLFRSMGTLFQLQEQGTILPDLVEDLEQAWREWKHARIYFNNVTDPDLIDYAIFNMGATEKKYIYLLKRARETGINVEDFEYRLSHRTPERAMV